MKQLLRDLPVPLLTFEYLDAFAQIESKYRLEADPQFLSRKLALHEGQGKTQLVAR